MTIEEANAELAGLRGAEPENQNTETITIEEANAKLRGAEPANQDRAENMSIEEANAELRGAEPANQDRAENMSIEEANAALGVKPELTMYERKLLEKQAQTGHESSWLDLVDFTGLRQAKQNQQEAAELKLYSGDYRDTLEASKWAHTAGLSWDEIKRINGLGDEAAVRKGFSDAVKDRLVARIKTREEAQRKLHNAEEASWTEKAILGLTALPEVAAFANPLTTGAVTAGKIINTIGDKGRDIYTLDENGNPVIAKDENGRELRGDRSERAAAGVIASKYAEQIIWTNLGLKQLVGRGVKILDKIPGLSGAVAKGMGKVAGATESVVGKIASTEGGRLALETGKIIGKVNDTLHFGSLPDMMFKSHLTELTDVLLASAPEERKGNFKKWLDKFTSIEGNAEMLTGIIGIHLLTAGYGALRARGNINAYRHLDANGRRGGREEFVAEYIGKDAAKRLDNTDLGNIYELLTSPELSEGKINEFLQKIDADAKAAKEKIDGGESVASVIEGIREKMNAGSEGVKTAAERIRETLENKKTLTPEMEDALDGKIAEYTRELGTAAEPMAKMVKDDILANVKDNVVYEQPEMLDELVAMSLRKFNSEGRRLRIHDVRGEKNTGAQLRTISELGITSWEQAETEGLVTKDKYGRYGGGARRALNIALHGSEKLQAAVRDGKISGETAERLLTASQCELGARPVEEQKALVDGILERAKGDEALARRMLDKLEAGSDEIPHDKLGEALDRLAEDAKADAIAERNGVAKETAQGAAVEPVETADGQIKTVGEIVDADTSMKYLAAKSVRNATPIDLPSTGVELKLATTRLGQLKGEHTNVATGIKAILSAVGIRKLTSNAAVRKSISNGFTKEQHNALAANVDVLFERSFPYENRPDRNGDPNIKSIKRFAAAVRFGDKDAAAIITVKESIRDGHRIYSVEGINIEALSPKLQEVISDRPAANSATTEGNRTYDSETPRVENSIANSVANVKSEPKPTTALGGAEQADRLAGTKLTVFNGTTMSCETFPEAKVEVSADGITVRGLTADTMAKPDQVADVAAFVTHLMRIAKRNGKTVQFEDADAATIAQALVKEIAEKGAEKTMAKLETRGRLFGLLFKTTLGSGVTYDEASFKKALEKVGNGRQFVNNHGDVYGFVDAEGVIHFNPATFQMDTPIHEYGHVALEATKKINNALWRKGNELIKGSRYYRELLEEIKDPNSPYRNFNEEWLCDEALARLIGDEGAKLVESKGLDAQLKSWLKEVWKSFKGALGIADLTEKQIEKMTIREFADTLNAELLKGSEFGAKKKTPPSRKSIRRYDEQTDSGSSGVLRWKNDRGYLFAIPVDMERTQPGGKVVFATDDANITDWIQNALNGYTLRLSKSGRLYVEGRDGLPPELAEIFGRYPTIGQNDGIYEEIANETGNRAMNGAARDMTPEALVNALRMDRANYDAWVQGRAEKDAEAQHYADQQEREAFQRWEDSGMSVMDYIRSRVEEGDPDFDLDWETARELEREAAEVPFSVRRGESAAERERAKFSIAPEAKRVSDTTRKEFADDPVTSKWKIRVEPEAFRQLEPRPLEAVKPVTESTDNNSVKKAVKKLFVDFGKVHNADDGTDVSFNPNDAGKIMMQSGIDMRTFAPQLKSLFETSTLAFESPQEKFSGHKYRQNVDWFKYYVNKFVGPDGNEKYIRFTVRIENNWTKQGIHAATVSDVAVYENENAEGRTFRAHKLRGAFRGFTDFILSHYIGKGKGVGTVKTAKMSVGRLYTGSAADYDAPSLLKVGTGEGSQVYGWGLYASSVRGIAEGYAAADKAQKDAYLRVKRQSEPKRKVLFDGQEIEFDRYGVNEERTPESYAAKTIYQCDGSIDKAKNALEKRDSFVAKQALSWLIKNEGRITPPTAQEVVSEHIYEQTFFTNRAPGDESHLLNWYEPVSEENLKRVLDQAKKEGIELPDVIDSLRDKELGEPYSGRQLYLDLQFSLEGVGPDGKPVDSPMKAASEFLARADIDGVKYPVDSYGKTLKDGDKAGWNYVSFRDDNINVDHKWVDGQALFSVGPNTKNQKEYAYDALIKRSNVKVPAVNLKAFTAKSNITQMIREAKRSVISAGGKNTSRGLALNIPAFGDVIVVGKRGIQHGLRPYGLYGDVYEKNNADVLTVLGEVLKESVPVNELNPDGTENKAIVGSTILLGACKTDAGITPVVSVVHHAKDTNVTPEVYVYPLKSVNAQKRSSDAFDTHSGTTALDEISIANLIALAQPLHPQIFSRDVNANLGTKYRGDEINARFATGKQNDLAFDPAMIVYNPKLKAMGETEQNRGGIAAGIEKKEALRPWTRKGSPCDLAKPIAMDCADMVQLFRAVSGSTRNPIIRKGDHIPGHPNAIGLNRGGSQIELANRLFGMVDAGDVGKLKADCTTDGYFRNENPDWCAAQTKDTVQKEVQRSRDELDRRTRELIRHRVATGEGGMHYATQVLGHEIGHTIAMLPRDKNLGSVGNAMRTLFDSMQREMKRALDPLRRNKGEPNLTEEVDKLITGWHGAETLPNYFKKPQEKFAELFGIFLTQPEYVHTEAPKAYDALVKMMGQNEKLALAYRRINEAKWNGTSNKRVMSELEKTWKKEQQDQFRKLNQLAREPISKARDWFNYALNDRFGPMFAMSQRSLKAEKKLLKQAVKEGAMSAEEAAERIRTREAEINALKTSLFDWQRQTGGSTRLMMADLDDVIRTAERDGVNWESVRTYAHLNRVIELGGRATAHGIDPSRAAAMLGDMARELGAENWTKVEKTWKAYRAVYERHVLEDGKVREMFGEDVMKFLDSNKHYVTMKHRMSAEESAEWMAKIEEYRAKNKNAWDPTIDLWERMNRGLKGQSGVNAGFKLHTLEGSFEATEDPIAATMMTALTLKENAARNHLLKTMSQTLRDCGVKGVYDTAMEKGAKEHAVDPGVYERLTYMDGGVKHELIVPLVIGKSFTTKRALPRAVDFFGGTMRFLRNTMTLWNPAFINRAYLIDKSSLETNIEGMHKPAIDVLSEALCFRGIGVPLYMVNNYLTRFTPIANTWLGKILWNEHTFNHYAHRAQKIARMIYEGKFSDRLEEARRLREQGYTGEATEIEQNVAIAREMMKKNVFQSLYEFNVEQSGLETAEILNKFGYRLEGGERPKSWYGKAWTKVKNAAKIYNRFEEEQEAVPKIVAYLYRMKMDEAAGRTSAADVDARARLVIEQGGTPNLSARGVLAGAIENATGFFWNVRKEGFLRTVDALKDHPTEWITKNFAQTAMPALLKGMIVTGCMELLIKKFFDDDDEKIKESWWAPTVLDHCRFVNSAMKCVPGYYQRNYNVIPLAKFGDEVLSLRVKYSPEEFAIQNAIHTAMQKFGADPTDPSADWSTLSENMMNEFLPNIFGRNYALDSIGALVGPLVGINPYDQFRQRHIYDDNLFKARALRKGDMAKEMVKSFWNYSPLGSFGGKLTDGLERRDVNDELPEWLDGVLSTPFVKMIPASMLTITSKDSFIKGLKDVDQEQRAAALVHAHDILVESIKRGSLGGFTEGLKDVPNEYRGLAVRHVLNGWRQWHMDPASKQLKSIRSIKDPELKRRAWQMLQDGEKYQD